MYRGARPRGLSWLRLLCSAAALWPSGLSRCGSAAPMVSGLAPLISLLASQPAAGPPSPLLSYRAFSCDTHNETVRRPADSPRQTDQSSSVSFVSIMSDRLQPTLAVL